MNIYWHRESETPGVYIVGEGVEDLAIVLGNPNAERTARLFSNAQNLLDGLEYLFGIVQSMDIKLGKEGKDKFRNLKVLIDNVRGSRIEWPEIQYPEDDHPKSNIEHKTVRPKARTFTAEGDRAKLINDLGKMISQEYYPDQYPDNVSLRELFNEVINQKGESK